MSDWIENLIDTISDGGDLWQFQPQIGGRNVNRIRRALAGSLDAAMELREDMMPQSSWKVGWIGKERIGHATVGDEAADIHAIPSVALTLATLLAYQAKQEAAE